MFLLHIEHPVLDFDNWKRAFDNDPVGRERSGVRRYWISRSVEERNRVIIDLEFETEAQAAALLAAMRPIWGRIEGQLITSPQAHIAEIVETGTY